MLLQELVFQTREPGKTINMAHKMGCTSAELAQRLAQPRRYGLIDY